MINAKERLGVYCKRVSDGRKERNAKPSNCDKSAREVELAKQQTKQVAQVGGFD